MELKPAVPVKFKFLSLETWDVRAPREEIVTMREYRRRRRAWRQANGKVNGKER